MTHEERLRKRVEEGYRYASLYHSGMTMREVAIKEGKGFERVRVCLREVGITRRDGGIDVANHEKFNERAEAFAELYRQGKTLQEIGDLHKLTRERVRQIIAGVVSREEGGQCVRAAKKAKRVESAKALAFFEKYGCTRREYNKIRGYGSYRESPPHRYVRQKQNARTRSIEWQFNLKTWWDIWEKSGKWNDRGRGSGYVMARCGDTGPYSAENVSIVHAMENILEHYEATNGRGYHATRKKWGLDYDEAALLEESKPEPSPCKGVSWHKMGRKWRVYYSESGKLRVVGYFASKEEAMQVATALYPQKHLPRGKTSKHTGVHLQTTKSGGRTYQYWRANKYGGGKVHYLGSFPTEEEAAQAVASCHVLRPEIFKQVASQ